ncbi:type II toxin-antitoxin system Phd/YefM family antitoxin [Candidatus Gottesmanbacteria bacterium]|nr:type II toxin-antitoxin system Phd/YefM family antitoxin [Candidatus Gottesmanbacteria bacterium]
MQQVVSKSELKAKILEYLRNVEKEKQELIVTHAGKPVAKIIPYKEKAILDSLRNTVIYYKDPTESVGEEEWELLK